MAVWLTVDWRPARSLLRSAAMQLGKALGLVFCAVVVWGCAEGAGRGGGGAVGYGSDGGKDLDGSADSAYRPMDAVAPPVPEAGRPDLPSPDAAADSARDSAVPDARPDTGTDGPDCVPSTEVCNGVDDDCDFGVDEAPIGGSLCGAGENCEDGVCQAISDCPAGFGDCDGEDGCELDHTESNATCAAAPSVGTGCGDVMCDWFCPPTDWSNKATRRGRTSAFYRGSSEECSGCCANLASRISLTVPAGVDYDLFVYRSCGSLLDSSRNAAGRNEEVILEEVDDCAGVENVLNYWVEVRHVGGTSCAEWVLRFDDRSCSSG